MECSLNNENYVDVYRVEKRGRGPYNNSGWGAGDFMTNSLPTPDYDAGLPKLDYESIQKYRFGAPTVETMKSWIKYPRILSAVGYKVSLYKAKKKYVYASTIQSMFIKRHAKKVKEWTVEEFMKEN